MFRADIVRTFGLEQNVVTPERALYSSLGVRVWSGVEDFRGSLEAHKRIFGKGLQGITTSEGCYCVSRPVTRSKPK